MFQKLKGRFVPERDSGLVKFLINYIIAEILFFIGTGILVTIKMVFNWNMEELLQGTFIGSAVKGLFSEAFSATQINWITRNILIWPVNTFLAFFSSLLLVAGFFAIAILIPLPDVNVFEGTNAIAVESMPIGFLFLFCWGIMPLLYLVRSSWIGWGQRIKDKISPSVA